MIDAKYTDMPSARRVTPVTVLTGFLGSGKTTLLNHILTGDHGVRIAVLVNDFGTINIDADLVVGVTDEQGVINLANGCVCCSIREDLLGAVLQVLSRPEKPEYIVLEASGVAEPSGIAATFLDAGVGDQIRLDSIMCVIDASQVFAAPEMMDLKLRQMAFADLLILNKADLVSDGEMRRLRAWLEDRFDRHRLVAATRANLPLEILLGVGRFDAQQITSKSNHTHDCNDERCDHPDHAALFDKWSFECDQALALDALRESMRSLPACIYRCKGVIHSSDAPTRRSILQVVGKRVDLTLDSEWGNRRPRTQIVVIGAHGSLDVLSLQRRFESCIAKCSSVWQGQPRT